MGQSRELMGVGLGVGWGRRRLVRWPYLAGSSAPTVFLLPHQGCEALEEGAIAFLHPKNDNKNKIRTKDTRDEARKLLSLITKCIFLFYC